MTKEITKAVILQEIQDKFKLREFDPAKFLFSETVTPVYNIEPHLEDLKQTYTEMSITATGGYTMFTVPANQTWYLNGYNVIFMGAGALTVSGVYTYRRPNISTVFLYLDLTAAQTVSYAVNLPKAIVLTSGDKVGINVDGYTSTQALRLYIDYMMEEVR